MKFILTAKTEQGKSSLNKILNHKGHKRAAKALKINEDPLTISWIIWLIRNADARRLNSQTREYFKGTIREMLLEDGSIEGKDYTVGIE